MSAIVGDGSPLTANGVVGGTQLGSYTLPLLGTFRVESVVAQIDASAAPAVTPTVRVKDKSGAVIATKRQSSTIPAGDTGSATWALRLGDDAGGAGLQFDTDNEGGWLDVTANNPDATGAGMALTDTVGTYPAFSDGIVLQTTKDRRNIAAFAGGNVHLNAQHAIELGARGGPSIEIAGATNESGVATVLLQFAGNIFRVGPTLAAHLIEATHDSKLAFYGAAPIVRPTVNGSRGGNAALASLLTSLAALGLIVDGTTP